MNIHHLELFYYVARHGGISEAVRNIPYGIQQPAVSAQVIQLEQDLGVTLFHRRPFALTPAGEELQGFITPFFSSVDEVAQRIRGGATRRIRIGSSEIIQRDHLPEIVSRVREKFPGLRLGLRNGYGPQLQSWLLSQDLDLVITALEGKPPPGVNTEEMIRLHPALLVEENSPIRSGEDLWQEDRIDETLITVPKEEPVCRHFLQALRKRGVDWFPSLEVSSLSLVETYVENGFGVGLGIYVPKAKLPPGIRMIPLLEFPPLVVGAMWMGMRTPLIDLFIRECHGRAEFLKGLP